MLFGEHFWLSVLIPILVAPIPVGASLLFRQRRAPALEVACLALAGLAIAFVFGGAFFAVTVLGFMLFTHWAALHIAATQSRARVMLMTVVFVQIGLAAAAARLVIADSPPAIGGTLVPFGVSFYAFHGISYLVNVHRRRVVPESDRLRLALYLILLPPVVAGPVVYDAATPQLARRLPSVSDYSFGVRRLVIGVWKVFVMAGLAAAQADAVFALRPARLSGLEAWVGLTSFTLQMYYAFSGYADMAVGIARMFGVRLPENFRWPMVADSVRGFWQRWHIGLSAWVRECVDVSAEGRRSALPPIAAEAVVAMFCGIWYGIGPTFVLWGAWHALLIGAEGAGLEAILRRLPPILRHVYLVWAVMLGWLLLRSATLGDARIFARALIGANGPVVPTGLTFGYDVWLTLAAGAIGCAPLSPMVRRWTVAIDALIISALMASFASLLFTWRGVRMVVNPVIRFWRGSPDAAGRP